MQKLLLTALKNFLLQTFYQGKIEHNSYISLLTVHEFLNI